MTDLEHPLKALGERRWYIEVKKNRSIRTASEIKRLDIMISTTEEVN